MADTGLFVSEAYLKNLSIWDTDLLFCGRQTCAPGHAYGPFLRTHSLFVYISKGKGIFRTKNHLHHLGAGSTFFIFPGEITYYEADHQDPWDYTWVAYKGETINQRLLRASISPQTPVFMSSDTAVPESLFSQFLSVCLQNDPRNDLKILSLFLEIICHYTMSIPLRPAYGIAQPQLDYVDRAVEYIKMNYHNPISVSQIARNLGLSRGYFSDIFCQRHNVPPARFIRDYRLKVASILLLTTEHSISSIAQATGFNDYNYFSTQFSKNYGISPTEYRKEGNKYRQ